MAEASILTAGGLVSDDVVAALSGGRYDDPFAVLGPHRVERDWRVRAFLPGARAVSVIARGDGRELGQLSETPEGSGLFDGAVAQQESYRLRIRWSDLEEEIDDPYSFGPVLGEVDLHLFAEGRHFELGRRFGAQPMTKDGVRGVSFAVWAPNARAVSVVGDFNLWDGRRHPMRRRAGAGVWEIFLPGTWPGQRYKYRIIAPDGSELPLKADPIALQSEPPPATASIISNTAPYRWRDATWMAERAQRQRSDAPMSIYEVHAASWLRPPAHHDAILQWPELAERLVPYAVEMGFTHIELMPIAEHPFGGSWGYQPLGLFAPSARFGSPEGLRHFVDVAHRAGLGVIVDWVPAHFPTDAHGLARFDGTALYEHLDPREGFHRDWNTFIYNFGRREVQEFLIGSAVHWLEQFHIDGLRVDAVASMLYRDYSRGPNDWIPNIYGGRENLEAIGFLRHLNSVIDERCPGAVVIAEESTAWPGVSRPVGDGGLGFAFKWNMGWMHDTLRYMATEPVHRKYHHDDMTFGLLYAFSENFILPLSHDEVVYGKGSLIGKMPGDLWQRFANLRAYLGFMWAHPGKKLLFMGGEIAQWQEWNHDGEIDWNAADNALHQGVRHLLRDLNRLYRDEGALWQRDADASGFRWIIGDDRDNSTFAFLRQGQRDGRPLLAVSNMTPVPRSGYRIGVPIAGGWREVVNTDAAAYGGSNVGNGGEVHSIAAPSHGYENSLDLTLPPLATLYLLPNG